MLRLLIVISVISACSIAKQIPNNGRSNRIIGGSTARPGQFPFQASLRNYHRIHYCGGAILNRRFVVTAAHCVFRIMRIHVNTVVGAHHRSRDGTFHLTDRVFNHPQYNATSISFDVSLVRTAEDIIESPTVSFISIASSFIQPASGAVVTGWGHTSFPGGSDSELLQFLRIDVISNDECRSRLDETRASRINQSSLCATSAKGRGTCSNDSGGPLVLNGLLIGVVSWGVPCATDAPDVFGRLSTVNDWINAQMDV